MQAAIPLMIGAAVVSAGGALMQGAQNKAVFNAKAREEQAQGVAERSQHRAAARAAMGRQVMSAAESGFAPGVGTALTELEESLVNRELDLLTSKRNASARAAGLRQQGKFAMRQGAFGAVGALMGGASSVAGHMADMKAAGA